VTVVPSVTAAIQVIAHSPLSIWVDAVTVNDPSPPPVIAPLDATGINLNGQKKGPNIVEVNPMPQKAYVDICAEHQSLMYV
jgi:hypothetical protein